MRILVLLLLVVSCGKKESKKCRSSEEMQYKCQVQYIPNYGRVYAQRVCSEQYLTKRCY